ncbi:glycine betaine ABC transporter substrate-binding protein [Streptomyces phaeofaciens JCM 4814]|uniref:Glycine/betaine ABC transporter substrate-binding protein n=1 Tax=Streptomyces phaeofaciens TaxID=68254 RepID=A0A918H8N0_9ACTN|nr:glycine/betaine ABC transporter substrate-binding protein [Streptomyces phaeofaciens]
MRRVRAALTPALVSALVSGCGLSSGSPMADDVLPGTVGRGEPLAGARLTVTSKSFTENLVLGAMMGIAFQAAGAEVVDRTGIQGSIGPREAVRKGEADAMYEYTGTAWITYQGNSEPLADARAQWRAVRDADLGNGLTWLPQSRLNNTYALAMNRSLYKEYDTDTLSEVAALGTAMPGAVTLCVEGEFANRADGLPGMQKAYGMNVPASRITQMDTGIIYSEAAKGRCTYGEVYTTDGRIPSMDLVVMADDRKFFPHYNAAPEINSRTLKKWPAIADVLAPVTAKLDNAVARELNARVDVDGEDPHQVALEWMRKQGFVK